MFKTKHYIQSLFLAHLSLEKLCKAIWVQDNEKDHPPGIHNLVYLLKQTKLELTEEELDFFLVFNDFQLEGRYPDYQQKIYQRCNELVTNEWLQKAKHFKTWLHSKLQ